MSKSASHRVVSEGIALEILTGIHADQPVCLRFAVVGKAVGILCIIPHIVAADIDECEDRSGILVEELV